MSRSFKQPYRDSRQFDAGCRGRECRCPDCQRQHRYRESKYLLETVDPKPTKADIDEELQAERELQQLNDELMYDWYRMQADSSLSGLFEREPDPWTIDEPQPDPYDQQMEREWLDRYYLCDDLNY